MGARLGCNFPHVRLQPESLDYWSRRGGKSIYARTQSQPDRICTVEAVALLLRELGEREENCDALIDYVKVNNLAPHAERDTETSKNGTHHCLKGKCRSCRARALREERAKAAWVGNSPGGDPTAISDSGAVPKS